MQVSPEAKYIKKIELNIIIKKTPSITMNVYKNNESLKIFLYKNINKYIFKITSI